MNEDKELAKKIAESLNAASERYDAETIDKLAQARRAALEAIPARANKRSAWSYWGIGLASVSSLVLAIIFTWAPQGTDSELLVKKLEIDEFEVLLESEDLEMLASDVEFYLWLETELEENT